MDLKPTEQMAKNAERGLELRKEFNRGGTEVGVARATQLKNRENLSPETIKRMTSYFARHAGDNLSETDPPSAGYIAWLLWGGDAGRDWAERKAKQIDDQKENAMKAIDQKKLAVIKSNAAPEVKLRALERLDNAAQSPLQKELIEKAKKINQLAREVQSIAKEATAISKKQYANESSYRELIRNFDTLIKDLDKVVYQQLD